VRLDRSSIEKRDFSASRRGYDAAEVDRHLAEIADAVEELQRGSSAAGAAAQRVQAIIEAAEKSAGEIEAGARKEADAIRKRAQEDTAARSGRAEQLLDEVTQELERVRDALRSVRQGAAEAAGAEAPGSQPATEDGQVDADAVEAEAPGPGAPRPEDEAPEPEPAATGAEDEAPTPQPGADGARLIALNMAMNGTPREETARYLAENFELDDPDAVLDDVYERAGS
jgi:DivIVA domain-containing protein